MAKIVEIKTFTVPPRWVFVRVATDDGLVGWGEAIVPKRVRAVVGAIEDMAFNIADIDSARIEDVAQRLRRGGYFRGGPILATAAE